MIHITIILLLNVAMCKRCISLGSPGTEVAYLIEPVPAYLTSQINALIAPRAHLALAGNYDRLMPPAGLDKIDLALKQVHAACGVPQRWAMLRYEAGHYETAHGRAAIIEFLKTWL